MARVKDNVQHMADMGAGRADIDAYLQQEKVTAAQMRQYGAVSGPNAPVRLPQKDTGDVPNFLERYGHGMYNVDPARMAYHAVTGVPYNEEQAQLAEQRYQRDRPQGFDWPSFMGEGTALAPLGLIPGAQETLLGRAVVGAGVGGMAGGLLHAQNGQERLSNTLFGAATGSLASAAIPPLARGAGALYAKGRDLGRYARRFIDPKFKATITGQLDDAARAQGMSLGSLGAAAKQRLEQDAANMVAKTGKLDADALLRMERARQFGFREGTGLLRGQATRDPSIFTREQNLAKRSTAAGERNLITERLNNQLSQIDDWMAKTRRNPALQPEDVGDAIEIAAKTKSELLQKGVREAYQEVEKAIPGIEFSRKALKNRVSPILQDMEDYIDSGVRRRINEIIIPDKSGNYARPFTADEMIKLDKLITQNMPGGPLNKSQGIAASKLKQELLGVMDDTAANVPTDLFAMYQAAKQKAADRFAAIGKPNKLTGQLVAGTSDPGKLVNKVMTGPVKDVRKLKEFLEPKDWSTLQAGIENKIYDRAYKSGAFRQASYNSAIESIGQHRLELIFGPEKAQQLIAFGQTARDIIHYPPLHAINTSNTAPETASLLKDFGRAAIESVPGGRLTTGLLSMAREGANQRAAQQAEQQMIIGLLNPIGPLTPTPNPVAPALPYLRYITPPFGILGAQGMGE